MAKDNETVLEDQEIPGEREQEDRQEQEPPKDVRGAIRAAIAEQNADESDSKDEKEPSKERSREKRSARSNKEDENNDDPNSNKNLQKKNDSSDGLSDGKKDSKKSEDESGVKKEDTKIDPPGFFKVKGKAVWDKLSPEDRQVIIAREKEVSDGFAQVSARFKPLAELEQVIAPRLSYIQAYGTTPAQTVDRLFQWMERLGDQNPAVKLNSFKELARSFKIDLNQLASRQPQAENTEIETELSPNEPPPWFEEYTNVVGSEINGLKQHISTQQKAAAENYVTNWAKDKPHYALVAPLMGQLIKSEVVPLKNGNVDLDGAYEAAVKLHPEVAADVQRVATEKAEAEATEKAAKDAKDKMEKLNKAKRAGASLKPAARSLPSEALKSKSNGSGKSVSVRDSIKAAFEEVRE